MLSFQGGGASSSILFKIYLHTIKPLKPTADQLFSTVYKPTNNNL